MRKIDLVLSANEIFRLKTTGELEGIQLPQGNMQVTLAAGFKITAYAGTYYLLVTEAAELLYVSNSGYVTYLVKKPVAQLTEILKGHFGRPGHPQVGAKVNILVCNIDTKYKVVETCLLDGCQRDKKVTRLTQEGKQTKVKYLPLQYAVQLAIQLAEGQQVPGDISATCKYEVVDAKGNIYFRKGYPGVPLPALT